MLTGMATRVRIWHPDYPPSWTERLLDLFHGYVPAPTPAGVDLTLMAARERRTVRAFLDECGPVVLLGHEMVKADSRWALPEGDDERRAAAEALALRLRFGQVHAGELRLPMAARWFEVLDLPNGGTRCLIRLIDGPSPHLRSFLAANLGPDSRGPWTEVAVGG
ncbi:hypothetical protein LBMAG42_17940 [Deltaproteobacteria bacterium]|nr:hypothetical protein LBMAG42_17940 [Deltaproteobacteria bacterium]